MKTPIPTAKTYVVTAPAHVTAAIITSANTAAVSAVQGGMAAVVVNCAGITLLDPAAISALQLLAQAVRLSTASVHLYDIPVAIMQQLGPVTGLFSSYSGL